MPILKILSSSWSRSGSSSNINNNTSSNNGKNNSKGKTKEHYETTTPRRRSSLLNVPVTTTTTTTATTAAASKTYISGSNEAPPVVHIRSFGDSLYDHPLFRSFRKSIVETEGRTAKTISVATTLADNNSQQRRQSQFSNHSNASSWRQTSTQDLQEDNSELIGRRKDTVSALIDRFSIPPSPITQQHQQKTSDESSAIPYPVLMSYVNTEHQYQSISRSRTREIVPKESDESNESKETQESQKQQESHISTAKQLADNALFGTNASLGSTCSTCSSSSLSRRPRAVKPAAVIKNNNTSTPIITINNNNTDDNVTNNNNNTDDNVTNYNNNTDDNGRPYSLEALGDAGIEAVQDMLYYHSKITLSETTSTVTAVNSHTSELKANTLESSQASQKTTLMAAVKTFIPNATEDKGLLRVNEGDVLLVTLDESDEKKVLNARLEATGQRGLVYKWNVRKIDSMFADILAGIESLNNASLNTPTAVISKQEISRQQAINELVETERAFRNDMLLIHQHYYKPLIELQIDVSLIFSNLEEIIKLSTLFYQDLATSATSATSTQSTNTHTSTNSNSTSSVLLEWMPKMEIFTQFCVNMSKSLQTIEKLKLSNKQFSEFLHVTCQKPEFGQLDLSSFLLKPMQRLTKLPLLIAQIQKYTDSHSDSHLHLSNAQRVAQQILHSINVKCGEEEERSRLAGIHARLIEELFFNNKNENNFDSYPLTKEFMQNLKLYQYSQLNGCCATDSNGNNILTCGSNCVVGIFDDCILLFGVLSKQRHTFLFNHPINIWQLQFGVTAATPETTVRPSTTTTTMSIPRLSSLNSINSVNSFSTPQLLLRHRLKSFNSISNANNEIFNLWLFDPLTKQTFELQFSQLRHRNEFIDRLETCRKQLTSIAKLETVISGLDYCDDSDDTHDTHDTHDWAGGVTEMVQLDDSLLLFAHKSGLYGCQIENSKQKIFQFKDFQFSCAKPLLIERPVEYLAVQEGIDGGVEAYRLDSIRQMIPRDPNLNVSNNNNIMKISKLHGSKASVAFGMGMVGDQLYAVVATADCQLLVYQFTPVGRLFRRIGEYRYGTGNNSNTNFLPSNCVNIRFTSCGLFISNLARFHRFNVLSGKLEEYSLLRNISNSSKALDCIQLSPIQLLFCYEGCGVIVNYECGEVVRQRLNWYSKALQFRWISSKSVLIVYSENFIELWQLNNSLNNTLLSSSQQPLLNTRLHSQIIAAPSVLPCSDYMYLNARRQRADDGMLVMYRRNDYIFNKSPLPSPLPSPLSSAQPSNDDDSVSCWQLAKLMIIV